MKVFIFLTSFIMLMSCATFKYEPKSEDDSILIGCIEFKAQKFDKNEKVQLTGKNTQGIQLELIRLKDNQIIKAKSFGKGFFYLKNPIPGKYKIKSLYYKKQSGKSYSSVKTYPNLIFKIEDNRINCLNTIYWTRHKKEKKSRFQTRKSIDKDMFLKEFPETKWVEGEWNHITFY